MKHTTPPTAWKYRVRPLANFRDGRFWDEWRIERSRQVPGGHHLEVEPVCDVPGKRSKALALARTLNGVQKITIDLAKYHRDALHWMAVAANALSLKAKGSRVVREQLEGKRRIHPELGWVLCDLKKLQRFVETQA